MLRVTTRFIISTIQTTTTTTTTRRSTPIFSSLNSRSLLHNPRGTANDVSAKPKTKMTLTAAVDSLDTTLSPLTVTGTAPAVPAPPATLPRSPLPSPKAVVGGGGGTSAGGVVEKKKKIKRKNKIVEAFFLSTPVTDHDDDEKQHQKKTEQALQTEIHKLCQATTEFCITNRRTLHRIPEIMYNEKQTSIYIQKTLKQLGISFTTGWGFNTNPDRIPGKGGYGIVADIGTGRPPCVLLRADMDALPIQEKTTGIDDFKSIHDGKMHACGHVRIYIIRSGCSGFFP
jgi:hypothetical protein